MWLRTKITLTVDDIVTLDVNDASNNNITCMGMVNTDKIIAIRNYTSKQISLDGDSHYYIKDGLYAVTDKGIYELADYSSKDYNRLMEILTLYK